MTWNIHGGGPSRRNRDLDRIVAFVRRQPRTSSRFRKSMRRRMSGRCRAGLRISGRSARDARGRGQADHRAGRRLRPCRDQPLADAGHCSARRFARGARAARGGRDDRRDAVRRAACRRGASRPELQGAAPPGRAARGARPVADRRAPLCSGISTTGSGAAPCSALAECMAERSHHKTFPAWLPLFALDRVYCRPARFSCEAGPIRKRARSSDHLPVIADLALASANASG